ncbi:MAG: hypothetical protein JWM46_410 [Candidatus Kaiserbacteria bacterium]|nr:hypothetical protein [Candidatus Kaiserbacteria bacterium]
MFVSTVSLRWWHSTTFFAFENRLAACYYPCRFWVDFLGRGIAMAIVTEAQRQARIIEEKVREEHCLAFVRESELISGVGVPDDAEQWRGGTKRHLELARIIAKPGGNLINVCLLNTTLTDRKKEWFRTGTEGAMKGELPDGNIIPDLIERLNRSIDRKVKQLMQDGNEQEKDDFAWEMHDLLISIHAFKSCNGRTARMLMNHIRVQLGLPLFVIKYEKSDDYYAKLHEYKRDKFPAALALLRTEEAKIAA